jgi:transcriptional regulator with PAS, ATPase and Fis domain
LNKLEQSRNSERDAKSKERRNAVLSVLENEGGKQNKTKQAVKSRLLASLLSSIDAPIVIIDETGDIKFHNSPCKEFLNSESNIFHAQKINQQNLKDFVRLICANSSK